MITLPSRTSPIGLALSAAVVFVGVSAALASLAPEHITRELAQRIFGVVTGLLVVVYANVVPKALTPMARMRCSPAAEQSIRRFTGWSLVLGGLAYAIAWVVAPLPSANVLAGSLLGVAVLSVLVRWLWAVAKRRSA